MVSAVIVNLDARELLLACVESLERALARVEGDTEVVVVDNGSRDGGPAAVRERHTHVRLLELDENRGYAAAVNAGVRAARFDWLLLLNNDTTIEPDAVVELLRVARGRDRVGSLAAQMRFAARGELNSCGFGVDALGVAFDRHVGRPPEASESSPTPVFGACAGAALMRRAMLDDVGGFDESFFMYLEDVDLAWRARMRGWKCLYVPSAVVHHHHSATSRLGSAERHFHVGRNRIRLLAKHMPTRSLLRRALGILAYELAYVAFAMTADGTIAPLRGRLRGLREWRAYRARGAGRRPVVLSPPQGAAEALRRRARVRTAASPHRDGAEPGATLLPPANARRVGRRAMLALQPALRRTPLAPLVGRALERLRARSTDRGEPALGPDGLPVPPARLRVGVVYSPQLDSFLEGGSRTAATIRQICERHRVPVTQAKRVLEVGCGCGRVTRHWHALSGVEIHATDVNAEAIAWVNENLPFVRAVRNELWPPLSYEDASFDIVYAISVFTHLSEPLGVAWMRELHRIARPGGLVLFSVNTRGMERFMTRRERAAFAAGRLVVQFGEAAGANICSAYHPLSYVERLTGDFERLEVVPPAPGGHLPQDLWVVRKPVTRAHPLNLQGAGRR